jgi:hypothetical protein
MNRNAANAVLKSPLEPPPNAVLLMVAHAPACCRPSLALPADSTTGAA